MTPEQAVMGLPIAPLKRMEIMDEDEWEEFVLEWVHYLKTTYQLVERCAGAGDMGRDVIATVDATGTWDNYQCKHYDEKLAPNRIWIELGKLCYYTFKNEFSVPRAYYFAAPKGLGPSLSKLLKKPEELRQDLIDKWDEKCKDEISAGVEIRLEGDLLDWVNAFDFSIFKGLTPLQMFDGHKETPHHFFRFGGGLPPRSPILEPPLDIQAHEQKYIQELFGAYADEKKCVIGCSSDLEPHEYLKDHFSRSRVQFYSAESLRNFSRDTLPGGQFEQLQNEVYSGVVDVVYAPHETAFRRVVATTTEAKRLHLDSHPLYSRLSTDDRFGICHQLVNDNRLRWTL